MDIAYQIASYLATAGFGTLGTSIFASQIPDGVNGVWVERLGGQLNKYVPLEESVLLIYSKNTNGQSAVQKLEEIKRFIHRMHDASSGTASIYSFLVLGDIEIVQRDIEYAQVYKLTLQVIYRDTGVIS
jgi:hypothetical protein